MPPDNAVACTVKLRISPVVMVPATVAVILPTVLVPNVTCLSGGLRRANYCGMIVWLRNSAAGAPALVHAGEDNLQIESAAIWKFYHAAA